MKPPTRLLAPVESSRCRFACALVFVRRTIRHSYWAVQPTYTPLQPEPTARLLMLMSPAAYLLAVPRSSSQSERASLLARQLSTVALRWVIACSVCILYVLSTDTLPRASGLVNIDPTTQIILESPTGPNRVHHRCLRSKPTQARHTRELHILPRSTLLSLLYDTTDALHVQILVLFWFLPLNQNPTPPQPYPAISQ